jgi:hypothetical protein
MRLILLVLFLFLFPCSTAALTSQGKADAQHSAPLNAEETANRAGRDLVTFNRAVASAVLIIGCLFVVYCIRRNNKTGARRKTDGRPDRSS